jgi:chromosome segregation protein
MPHIYPLNLFNERGVVGVAARLVRVDQRYRPLIDTLLGRVIVVDGLEVATRMVRRGLGSVVTRDGVLLRQGGSMYGGRTGAGAETFSVIRELETIPAEIEQAQLAEERARARLSRSQDAVEDARDAVAAARKLVDEAEERRRLQEEARTRLRRDLGSLSGQMRLAHAALREDGTEGSAAAEARARLGALQGELVEVAAEIAKLRDRSSAVSAERDQVSERVTAAAAALAAAEGERDAARTRRTLRAEEQRAARERLEQRKELLAAVRREAEDIELSLRDLRAQVANNRTALAAAEAAVGPAHSRLAEALGEQRELGATRGDVQNRLFAAERDMLTSDAALRQAVSHRQMLRQQIADEGLEVALDGTVRPAPPAPQPSLEDDAPSAAAPGLEAVVIRAAAGGADVDPEELRSRITDLRASIRNLGPVNIDALDDLSEERERHDFLTHQVSDLEAAEAELRIAIRDLEKLIRARFDETFGIVNKNFQMYFERFFGGGSAELQIVEPEEEGGDAGVEIFAQPPGKRIASLTVLSGGERSMTSVALLFALLSVNPAPVVVMDEVDAALDEANVGRFVDTLRELLGRSQFIIITHNRRTTESADIIYGISMGEESTSQVLSLNLEDLPRAS